MNNDSDIYEIEDRYCPICGNFIKMDSPSHRCSEKDIKKLFKEELEDDPYEEEYRSYDDKLNEFDEFYNSDNYYNIEEE